MKKKILLLLSTSPLSVCNFNKASAFQLRYNNVNSHIGTTRKNTHHHHRHHFYHGHQTTHKITRLKGEKYGRGAEIYPVTNEIDFKLTDSFANGVLPPSVQVVIDEDNETKKKNIQKLNGMMKMTNETNGQAQSNTKDNTTVEEESLTANGSSTSTSKVTNAINSILRSAAESQTEKSPLVDSTPFNKRPPFIALTLMTLGLITPNHILSVLFLSGYLIGLGFVAASPKSMDNMNPIVWSVPPQGHVPNLLSNPLGSSISNNPAYINWLRFGVVFGYLGPILYVIQTILDGQQHLSETIAANIFLLSCQITTEDLSRSKVVTPLPIRVLIPLMFNTLRMGTLYDWILCWGDMSQNGKGLAVVNFVYWGMNLFLFLIPVATMKYMRAYFYAVEAEEVAVRDGDEDSVGLLGR